MATSAGSNDTKLKWTYTRVFRLVNKRILNSGIITLHCPYYLTNLKYSIVGLE